MHRTLYFLIDCSRSMRGVKGDAVNSLMRKVVDEGVPEIKAAKSEDFKISIMALGYSGVAGSGVFEIIPKTDIENLAGWKPVAFDKFGGGAPAGAAIDWVVREIEGGSRGDPDPQMLCPLIVLIAGGEPDGGSPTYEETLQFAAKGGDREIKSFRKSFRIALGIGVDEKGRESLKKFGGISRKMEEEGRLSYFDCSKQNFDDFIGEIKDITFWHNRNI